MNQENEYKDDIAKTKYVPIPIHSSSGFNAAHRLNGNTDSDDDEDDALGRMVYNSSRTAQIRAAEAAAAMAEEASYDVSSGLNNTSSSSHHHHFQLEGTPPGHGSSSLPPIDSNSISSISYKNYSATNAGRTDEEDAKKQMIMKLYQQIMVRHVTASFLEKSNDEDGESAIEGSPIRDFSHHVPIKNDQTCAYYHKNFHRDKPELAKKIVYPGDCSSRKCPPLDEGYNKFAHKRGMWVDNETADTLATLANSTHMMYANDKSTTCGAKRKSAGAANDEHKRKRMESCNIYASPPEFDYFMAQYNRSYRPGVYSGSQWYQYHCPTPAPGMKNHDNPYYYPHAMIYSGSQYAKAKVARPQSIPSNDDDSGSDDERGRMIYNSSRIVQERRAAAAETTNNNDIQSNSPHASGSNDEPTISITTETKRKSNSVQYDQKKKKKRVQVRKNCSSEGCTNREVQGGVCIKHGAKVKICSTEGCTNRAVQRGVCVRHGAKVKICSTEGCTNLARKGGVCKRHGGEIKKYTCSHEGCKNQVEKGGVCRRHDS